MLDKINNIFNRSAEPSVRAQSNPPINTSSMNYSELNKLFGLGASGDEISAIFSAKTLISNAIGDTPLQVFSVSDKEIVSDFNSIEQTTIDNPTDLHSRSMVIKNMILDCINEGNGYAIIKRNKIGQAIGLIPVNASMVTVTPDDYILPTSAKYVVAGKNGSQRTYDSSDILHIYMFTNDNYSGISLLSYATQSIELAKYAENTASKFYSRGGNVNAIVGMKGRSSKDKTQKVASEMRNALYNSGGLVFVESDMIDIKSVSIDPKNSQMLETREYNALDLCRYFNLPAGMINANGIEAPNNEENWLAFMTQTLRPYFTVLEEQFNKKLFVTRDKGKKVVKFREEYLLQADKKTQADYYSKLIMHGMITPKQASHAIGVETSEELQDQLFVNNNMIPIKALENTEEVAAIADNKLSSTIQESDVDENNTNEDGETEKISD